VSRKSGPGVGSDRLRHSIQQLQTWLKQPLLQLAVMEQNGELLVRFGALTWWYDVDDQPNVNAGEAANLEMRPFGVTTSPSPNRSPSTP